MVETLHLLKHILSDRTTTANQHRMMVGCYRFNEVDETHVLYKILQESRTDSDIKMPLYITDICAQNLTVPQVNDMLMTLLGKVGDDPSDNQPLAELSYKRTGGNPFFLITFVNMLQKNCHNHLLWFDLGTFQWKLDIPRIAEQTAATDNVADLMEQKLNLLSRQFVKLLQVASCLDTQFDRPLIKLVWQRTEMASRTLSAADSSASFDDLLDEAVSEMFWEQLPNGEFQCVHDHVKGESKDCLSLQPRRWISKLTSRLLLTLAEAAISLESNADFAIRQHQVGRALFENLEPRELEKAMFVVVNLLNKGQNTNQST